MTASLAFGDLLRRFRERARLSQEELAERAGLTANGIGALERGERRRPYPHTVRTLVDALGLANEDREALLASLQRQERATPVAPENPAPSLPAQLTTLIGRDGETAVARQLLLRPGVRLLTLVGPGGVGKSRLALRVAEGVGENFPDGIVFVPLAPLRDPAQVPTAIAQALGARAAAGADPLHHLVAALREKRLLLLLDNFEHVLDAAPPLAELLQDCPQVKLLATSRAALRLRGEQEYRVPPLALSPGGQASPEIARSPAVQLFVARAAAIDPNFALMPANAETIAAICARLDGLPLAIELAAARSGLFPPNALLAQLERGLQVLSSGPRDLPERQRTMRNAIAWSHDLLPPDERTLFRRLAVFAGGAGLTAIEAVCDPDGSAEGLLLDQLSALLHSNLVRPESANAAEPRVAMLETVRAYAGEQLTAAGEAVALHARHADHFYQLAISASRYLLTSEQITWLDLLEREQHNLRAAVRHLLDSGDLRRAATFAWAVWRFAWVRGLQREAREWAEEALALAGDAGDLAPQDRAVALLTIGSIAWSEGDAAKARRALGEALPLSTTSGDQRILGLVHMFLSLLDVEAQDRAGADKNFAIGLDLLRAGGELWAVSFILGYYGLAPLFQGDYALARRYFTESLAAARASGDRIPIHQALYSLGLLAQAEGDAGEATQRFIEGLTLVCEVRDLVNAGYFLKELAAIAAARGRWAPSASLLAAADTILRATGSPWYRFAPDQPLADRAALLRDHLGSTDFDAAWQHGRTLTLDQALAIARDLAGG